MNLRYVCGSGVVGVGSAPAAVTVTHTKILGKSWRTLGVEGAVAGAMLTSEPVVLSVGSAVGRAVGKRRRSGVSSSSLAISYPAVSMAVPCWWTDAPSSFAVRAGVVTVSLVFVVDSRNYRVAVGGSAVGRIVVHLPVTPRLSKVPLGVVLQSKAAVYRWMWRCVWCYAICCDVCGEDP